MIDHIYLPVSDLERSGEFYKKMLEPLGIDMPYKFDQVPQRGFAINSNPGFWLKNGEVAKDLYVAFTAKSADAVRVSYKAAIDAGGTSKAFGAEGAAVVVNYARDHEGAERVVREITGKGGRAIAVQGDVAQRSDAQRLVAEAKKAFGRLDVLVNNAGVFSFAPFEQFSEQEFHRQFNTNVLGMFLMIEAALPAFGAEGGSIINIGSEASVTAYPTLSIYVASKSAVNGLTRVLSKEFGPRKIRVNAVNPGGTETEGTHAAGVMGTEFKKQIIASTSLGRVGQPEDIARVAVFLGSDDAGWLTGETIFANGGHK